ncbi:DUF1189 domain-containing protein [Peribacillus deserti]|uniref:DUF1189 domain-containing protein n=1 Tax=Peribacillus deserti TaxID=673318 RepID=A0A2N5M9G3_9BACI|nr:DUF1189 domain-containing protein [Peribacillus deserti]PLT30996.1 DUF1189 domain-containing protein [Peribacillus deserti]
MNIFVQFYKSLYSPKDIARFRFQGIGKTILYLFFLSLISVLPSLYILNTEIVEGVKIAKSTINSELPAFEIKNGTLSSSVDKPFSLRKDDFNIFLDETGTLSKEEVQSKAGSSIALLKEEFVFSARGQSQSYPYSMAQRMDINNQTALNVLDKIQSLYFILLPVLSLMIYLSSAAILFFQTTIIALVGLFLAQTMKRKLQYRHLWRLTAYSITLATFFFAIMGLLQTQVMYRSFINWFVTLTILYLAIREVPTPKQKPRA